LLLLFPCFTGVHAATYYVYCAVGYGHHQNHHLLYSPAIKRRLEAREQQAFETRVVASVTNPHMNLFLLFFPAWEKLN